MKRTTYIMIGMLVTGVAMVCGLIVLCGGPQCHSER